MRSGLEAALKAKKSVIHAKASFAEAKAEVAFDDKMITEKEMEKAIEEAGFSVTQPEAPGSSRPLPKGGR
jgi:copper chaperone CopZ